MTDYVAVLTFPDDSTTYQAFSRVKNAADSLGVTAATIVERDESGQLKVTESDDAVVGDATLGGSLIGMLVGVLGGPIGMLLGLTVGTGAGALIDANRLDKGDEALAEFSAAVKPGTNAIVAETSEDDTSILDNIAAEYKGVVTRRPKDEVVDELEAQEDAADEAAKAARKAVKEKKKDARHEKHEERVANLKAKFHKD